MIYFVRAAEGGPIKIGITDDLGRRMAHLRCGRSEDLIVLATMPGGRAEERKLHRRFASSRRRGEWFDPTPDLLALVAEAIEQGHVPVPSVQLSSPTIDPRQEIDLAAMFGEFLEHLFGQVPESVRPVAALAGCSPTTAENWIRGKNFPGGLYLLKMAARDRRVGQWLHLASKAAALAVAESIDLPTAFKVVLERPAMMLAGLP